MSLGGLFLLEAQVDLVGSCGEGDASDFESVFGEKIAEGLELL